MNSADTTQKGQITIQGGPQIKRDIQILEKRSCSFISNISTNISNNITNTTGTYHLRQLFTFNKLPYYD